MYHRRCVIPNDLRLRVGNEVAQITLGGTPQQVADALTRFATSMGIPTTGTPTENLTAILEYIKDEVKRRSKDTQRAQLRAANEAAITQQVEADNAL